MTRFRQELFRDCQRTQQEKQAELISKKYEQLFANYFRAGSKQQAVDKSFNLIKKISKNFYPQQQYYDYANYGKWVEGVQIKDKGMAVGDLGLSCSQQNYSKWLKSRKEKILKQPQSQVERVSNQIRRDAIIEFFSRKRMARSKQMKIKQLWNASTNLLNKPQNYNKFKRDIGSPLYQSKYKQQLMKQGRLSPMARDQIYKLYQKGWNIRQISLKFGIFPQRTKVVIWARALLYTQIIPKLGIKWYLKALEAQYMYGIKYGFRDYGIDVQDMKSFYQGVKVTNWNTQIVDIERNTEEGKKRYEEAIQKINKVKKGDKDSKIIEKIVGKQNKATIYKNWIIHRGRGSNEFFLSREVFRKLTKNRHRMRYY